MPRVVNPVTVVELPGKVAINELFGGASCAPCGSALGPDISLAHVKAKAGFAEDWQAPAFDEYVLVLKGSVTIEHAHGPPAVVAAGCGVYLAKGERVRWVFKEDAEYVPICLPAFSPANVFREEPGHPPPVHDSHTHIYHLVQKPLWEACKAKGETYYPPTYEVDGFTHATADPSFLIGVANHFYKTTQPEWICLGMTRASLAAAQITLKFEDPSPVGTTQALNQEQSGGQRFPHIYGGIPPTGGVVFEERPVASPTLSSGSLYMATHLRKH
ncbi:hypothetical protein Ctob_012592 [Chrysochromulina tobinii]|uniref:(S)-ureidoglycine aminohydrolase cupin domain-containing protein n=1 Tax=Chrysochromulina tobinii TaxID=1460289 RepID=A0A0M0K049_9EUKA|nr:hypothetical protein Ctob_012592 [Chrysochromulina tobinii]|eukprot:KOO32271.1 hypothetical protein Ctob_012592 [Chrysochromulina sp. CCMP291]